MKVHSTFIESRPHGPGPLLERDFRWAAALERATHEQPQFTHSATIPSC